MNRTKIYLLIGLMALTSCFAASCKKPEKPGETPPAPTDKPKP